MASGNVGVSTVQLDDWHRWRGNITGFTGTSRITGPIPSDLTCNKCGMGGETIAVERPASILASANPVAPPMPKAKTVQNQSKVEAIRKHIFPLK
jgi:hypothetical protein